MLRHCSKEMQPYSLSKTGQNLGEILALIQGSFTYMEGRIDLPSSVYDLRLEVLAAHCDRGEIWAIGTPLSAYVFLTLKPERFYVGKLAVAKSHRGQGMARCLVEQAERRAQALGLKILELETRIELVENHRIFEPFGFVKTAKTSHKGYVRPTAIQCKNGWINRFRYNGGGTIFSACPVRRAADQFRRECRRLGLRLPE